MKATDLIDNDQLRDDVPDFAPGDEVKVHVRVVEGSKERIQVFQGNVIARQGGGLQETYTVRKLSYGVGVERTFPLHTPTVTKIEVVKRGDVRRAKLYYLRGRTGKAAKIREKRKLLVSTVSTERTEFGLLVRHRRRIGALAPDRCRSREVRDGCGTHRLRAAWRGAGGPVVRPEWLRRRGTQLALRNR